MNWKSFKDVMKGAFGILLFVSMFVFLIAFLGEWSREVTVRNAQAKLNASVIFSKIRIEKANSIAQANRIIGKSLKNNELYLKYMEIESLARTKNKVIYVPTESNMPMLEYCKKEGK